LQARFGYQGKLSRPDSLQLSDAKKVLFITHEASRTGAPMVLLWMLQWLRRHTDLEFEILICKEGALRSEFESLAPTHTPETAGQDPDFVRRFGLLYSNSICSGSTLEGLAYGDLPIVTHVHELDGGFDGIGPRNLAGIVRQTNHYIACSTGVAHRLHDRLRIPMERISVHHAMVDLAKVDLNLRAEPPESFRRRFDIPSEAAVLTACGTVDLRKGADLFVQVAAIVQRRLGSGRPLRFVWIGKTTNELKQVVEADIGRLGMRGKIRFVGELAAPHGLLALGDVFCLTSREDPFPLVMLESGALGKPVVCFEGGGGGVDFCAHGGGFAVRYLDAQAMAEKCIELILAPEQAKQIGRLAAESVHREFTTEAIMPGLGREIAGFLKSPPPMSPHRTANSSLGEIMGTWRPEDANDRTREHVAAQIAREAERKRVKALLAEGRRADAIESLVRAARLDMRSKDVEIIIESLFWFAEDLRELDLKKSNYLRTEAEKLARRVGYAGIGARGQG
jgi:hypothetical protein